jgi:hypothetical protein
MDDRDVNEMTPEGESELAPELIAALRETRELNPQLEERVVVALRERGMLRNAGATMPVTGRSRRVVPAWIVGAAAACLAFAAGLQIGSSRGESAGALGATPRDTGGLSVVAHLRVTAADYTAALARVEATDLEGSAAAVETFRMTADQIVRLAPDSPVSFAMQVAFPSSYVLAPARVAALTPAVIWF